MERKPRGTILESAEVLEAQTKMKEILDRNKPATHFKLTKQMEKDALLQSLREQKRAGAPQETEN